MARSSPPKPELQPSNFRRILSTNIMFSLAQFDPTKRAKVAASPEQEAAWKRLAERLYDEPANFEAVSKEIEEENSANSSALQLIYPIVLDKALVRLPLVQSTTHSDFFPISYFSKANPISCVN